MAKAAPGLHSACRGTTETSALCQKEGLSPGSPATKHLWGAAGLVPGVGSGAHRIPLQGRDTCR